MVPPRHPNPCSTCEGACQVYDPGDPSVGHGASYEQCPECDGCGGHCSECGDPSPFGTCPECASVLADERAADEACDRDHADAIAAQEGL